MSLGSPPNFSLFYPRFLHLTRIQPLHEVCPSDEKLNALQKVVDGVHLELPVRAWIV